MADFLQDNQASPNRQIQTRGVVGSSLSALFINPIEAIKLQLSPAGMMFTAAYSQVAAGGLYFGVPYTFLPSVLGRPFLMRTLAKTSMSPGMSQVVAGALGGGIQLGGAPGLGVITQKAVSSKVNSVFKNAIRASRKIPNPETAVGNVVAQMTKNLNKLPGGLVNNGVATPQFAKLINTTINANRIGGFLLPIAAGAALGSFAGRMFDLSYKAGNAALAYANSTAEHIRALEFGGTLGAGFKTNAAATERQRAVQALQRTHLAGRGALGSEALNYSAII
jgi:hypothetical protein